MANRQEKENTEMLRGAARDLNDVERNAMEIEEEIVIQGDRMMKIKEMLVGGNTLLGRIGRGINRMTRRQAMMSLMWCFVIFIILGIIGLIIYLQVKD